MGSWFGAGMDQLVVSIKPLSVGRWRRRRLAATCGLLLSLTSNSAASATPRLREPETGATFAAERRWSPFTLKAIGTGVLEWYSFDVYAAAAYVDAVRGKKVLERYLASPQGAGLMVGGRLDTKRLSARKSFYQTLLAAELAMSMHLTFVRKISGKRLVDSFGPDLRRNCSDKAAVGRFLALLAPGVGKWSHLIVTILPGGRVYVHRGSRLQPVIVSRALARGLGAVFLGERPMNPKLKRSLVRRADTLLR